MKKVSYRIVSYDPQKIGLKSITQKAIADFLQIVGLKLSPETIECEGKEELVLEWDQLGLWQNDDMGFRSRMRAIYDKAFPEQEDGTMYKVFLVTSIDIGRIVGLSDGDIAIASSFRVNNNLDIVTTATFHELGHTHGIPDEKRKCIGNYEKSNINDVKIVALEHKHKGKNAIFCKLGEHCLNTSCSMRQRLSFDNWKEHLTKERLPGKPYCDNCLANLKKFKYTLDYNEIH